MSLRFENEMEFKYFFFVWYAHKMLLKVKKINKFLLAEIFLLVSYGCEHDGMSKIGSGYAC